MNTENTTNAEEVEVEVNPLEEFDSDDLYVELCARDYQIEVSGTGTVQGYDFKYRDKVSLPKGEVLLSRKVRTDLRNNLDGAVLRKDPWVLGLLKKGHEFCLEDSTAKKGGVKAEALRQKKRAEAAERDNAELKAQIEALKAAAAGLKVEEIA